MRRAVSLVKLDPVALPGVGGAAQVAGRLAGRREGALEELETAGHACAGGMERAELVGLHGGDGRNLGERVHRL